jgi:hypothetical protein
MWYLRGFPVFAIWEDQGNVGGIDVLAPRQTHRPQQTALLKA